MFRIWWFLGIIVPLIIIFFFSLASDEVSLDKIVILRSISRNKTEEKGELIFVELYISNNGNRIPFLEIMDEVPVECTVNEGSNHWVLELDKGERIKLNYAIQCHERGRYKIGPIYLQGSDIFNFSIKNKTILIFNSFSVVPSLIKLRNLPIYRHKLLPETGSIPSLIYKGRDFDFQGVRDYHPGDEVRSINWRVTAKYNNLATNEYALDQAARVFVILDHTTSTNRVIDEGVKAALSSTEYLISQRNKVGFIGIGEFVEIIPAAVGKRQLLRINEYLIDTEPSYPKHNEIFELRLEKKLMPSLPPMSQIYFISPLLNRYIVDTIIKLVRRGNEILLFLPQLEEIREPSPYNPQASQLANAILTLEKAFYLKKISQTGIFQIPWYPSGPKFETMKVRRTK